jgi:hypothetical protein
MLNINNIMKKYQIKYISMGKVVSEMVEAVSRKAARKYMKEIGFEHTKCKHENIDLQDGLAECLDCGTRNY